jgi:hypothetical protein
MDVCERCVRVDKGHDISLFGAENLMQPSELPENLPELTQIEEWIPTARFTTHVQVPRGGVTVGIACVGKPPCRSSYITSACLYYGRSPELLDLLSNLPTKQKSTGSKTIALLVLVGEQCRPEVARPQ